QDIRYAVAVEIGGTHVNRMRAGQVDSREAKSLVGAGSGPFPGERLGCVLEDLGPAVAIEVQWDPVKRDGSGLGRGRGDAEHRPRSYDRRHRRRVVLRVDILERVPVDPLQAIVELQRPAQEWGELIERDGGDRVTGKRIHDPAGTEA